MNADTAKEPFTSDPRLVRVLLPLPLPEPYDYAVPDGMQAEAGAIVAVPLGPRQLFGVVWGDGAGEIARAKVKPITARFDVPPIPEDVRRFVDWVAAYTMTPPGQVLRMAVSVTAALETERTLTAFRLRENVALPPAFKMTAARSRIMGVLADGLARTAAALAEEAACGVGVVRGLSEAGLVESVVVPATRWPVPDGAHPGPTLSAEQAAAADSLIETIEQRRYAAVLLDGVTGSGKTEVYFEAVAAALRAGRQVLVLLPEIALSAQWLDRFARRFGARPAEWHSDLSPSRRRETWRAVGAGEARVVVGARSALFLPYPDLGLIVVDEEHEAAYKQEDGVVYHARDMAVARAHLAGFPIVLVSATPSLESMINAENGRYTRIALPARHGGAALPEVRLIDLRRDSPPARSWLAPSLRLAIARTIERGEQAMLFLNRRGYAPLTLCRACGHRLRCPNCTAWLVEHRLAKRLQCHHCGYTAPLIDTCPSCGEAGAMTACGPGVERVAEEALALFPDARTAIVASDTLGGPAAIQETVRLIADHELDLVIATQVLAKGHHFPLLTLVGVVDADLGLAGGDLRAGEHTFQLLHQVAGRAGRGERPGAVHLQTYMPEHPVMRALASGDRDGFYALEADMRRDADMPPFGRLVALIVSGEHEDAVERVARALGRAAPREDDVLVLGPAPAPLALLRGRHRRRLLLKARKNVPIQPIVADWLNRVDVPGTVRIQIDVDPQSFL